MVPNHSVHKGLKTKRLPHFACVLLLFAAVFRALQSVFQDGMTALIPNVKCVRIDGHQSHGGIGAILQRNQVALFLADRLNANLSFPHVHTEFEYNAEDFFSECPSATDECKLKQDKLFLNACPLGDCDCRFRALQPYLAQLPSHCRIISLENNGVRQVEYYGCYRDLMRRYFGGPKVWPKPYDALHYRQGNLAHVIGKAFSKRQLVNLMDAMCKLSDRDIIVVTEGTPEVPACGNRVVLAGNTSMEEALQIMQHAEHVSFGRSSFASIMADMASPKRVVLSILDYDFLRWLKAPKYTIVGRSGKLFHFDDADILQRAFHLGLEPNVYVNFSEEFDSKLSLPSRRWETETMLTQA